MGFCIGRATVLCTEIGVLSKLRAARLPLSHDPGARPTQAANPLLLLFLVAAVGYPLGQLRIRGSSLGVAAVLFVGLAAGGSTPGWPLRRVFVSNAEVAARPLRELDLERRFGAVVTRVRRGDVELLPTDGLRLEMGDRVRILAPARLLAEVAAFFGDSYRGASEVDVLTFGLGLALGLLLGALPLPLPGGARLPRLRPPGAAGEGSPPAGDRVIQDDRMSDAGAAGTDEGFASRAAALRTLVALAWPIVVSRSSQVVVGIADAVMVAPLGSAALAATTAGGINAFALFILPMGTVFIVASFSSQLFGRGDLAGARRYGWYGLAIAGATQLFALATGPLVPGLLARLQFAPDLREAMEGYLAIRLLSAGAVVGTEALANYYGGLGNTRLPMRASVAAMVLNVAGNWLLIDGHLGLPALGVRGAALASTLSTGVAFLGLLAVFLRDRGVLGAVRLRWSELWRVLRFGLPSGLNWFIEFAAFAFFVNVVVAGLGTTSLAALMTVIQVNSVAFMPAFGLASAGAILVGQAIGAARRDRVPGLVGLAFVVAAAWQSLVAAAYLAAPDLVLAAFAQEPSSAEAFLAAGRRMLVLSAAWQLFDAAATVLTESLRAAGDTVFTMWARVVIAWVIWAPGSWVSVRILGGGDTVAVGWFVFYLFALALALLLRFRSGAWRRIELTSAEAS